MHGKQIEDFVTVVGEEETLYKPIEGGKIAVVEDNYGQYGLVWAVRYDANGNEIDRFNMTHVAIITWAK